MSDGSGSVVTILGAGAMGSALATPLRERGHTVRLWGTWLDDHLIDAVEAGRRHPRTDVPLAPGIELFRSTALEEALSGADIVVLAVASQGVDGVIRLAAPHLGGIELLAVTGKGFLGAPDGTVTILPHSIAAIFDELGLPVPPIVAVGGPYKADEVAAGRPSGTVYGSADRDAMLRFARVAQTANYRIEVTDDVAGLEVAAPLKNAFAIALGISDGLAGAPLDELTAAALPPLV